MSVPYEIISTGSKGNAVVLNEQVLIDCGVPFKLLNTVYRKLRLVLLTHIHGDHFNRSTIRRLAELRPTLRFGCCRWLVAPLIECGVAAANIDVLVPDLLFRYSTCWVVPVLLSHDVPNCGYKIGFKNGRVFYATDTRNLHGIEAKNYDLYMVEANYVDEEIAERIRAKKENLEYAYERRVLETHLSKADADDFIYSNIGPGGEYVYLHCHQSRSPAGEPKE